jgi:long-chain acyl-CoA synthetase
MGEPRTGFRLWAAAEPDLCALVTADDRKISYGELFAEVNRLSHGLRKTLNVGDTVAIVMTNSPGMVAMYLAAMQSGLYLVTLN